MFQCAIKRSIRVAFRDLPPMSPARGGDDDADDAPAGAAAETPDPVAHLPGIPGREAWDTALAAYRAFWERHGHEPMELRRFRRHPLEGTGLSWVEPDPECRILPDAEVPAAASDAAGGLEQGG